MTKEEAQQKAHKLNRNEDLKMCPFIEGKICSARCMAHIPAKVIWLNPSEPITDNGYGVNKPLCKRLE